MRPVIHKGFTLIELLIVVAIVAVLGTIAMSNYGDYVDKSRCTEGRTALLSGASALEKCKAVYGVYNPDGQCNGSSFLGDTPDGGHFSVTMVRDATTFTLTSTGQGATANNSYCSIITLNHLGVQGGTGSSPW